LKTNLGRQLRAKTDKVYLAVFDKNHSSKLNAYEMVKKRRDSGYKANLTNAENMTNPAFRSTFKLIVQERFSEQFAGVADISRLK
jgi:hypothetical protein